MKKIFLLFGAIVFSVNGFSQAPAIQWQKSLGGTNDDRANSIKQTSDGGYIAAGYSTSNDSDVTGNHGGKDFWIVKLDNTGTLQWQKSLGGTNDELAQSVQVTSDGGSIVAGYTYSNNGDVTGNHDATGTYPDFWIVKLDSIGNIQWSRCYGGTSYELAWDIQLTNDGGYVIAGSAQGNNGDVSGNHGGDDFWIVKIDSLGTIQWQKCRGGSSNEIAYSIMQTADGGYITAGFVTWYGDGEVTGFHTGTGIEDIWVVKLTPAGNIQWQGCLGGGNGGEYAFSVMQTSDGGYIICGVTNSTDGDVTGNHGGGGDYWVIKLNSFGSIQWQHCFGSPCVDSACDILQTSNGGYVISGYTYCNGADVTNNHGNYDYWIVKTTSTGSIQWQMCYGGTAYDAANELQQTNDGGYIVAGSSQSANGDVTGNHGDKDFWVVKLYPDILTSTIENNFLADISIFPNPATSEIIVQSSKLKVESIEVYNVVGERVKCLTPTLSKGEGVRIDASSLTEGIYFVKVLTENGTVAAKFVKQ